MRKIILSVIFIGVLLGLFFGRTTNTLASYCVSPCSWDSTCVAWNAIHSCTKWDFTCDCPGGGGGYSCDAGFYPCTAHCCPICQDAHASCPSHCGYGGGTISDGCWGTKSCGSTGPCCDPDAWGGCSVPCGGGIQYNDCGTPQACNTYNCPQPAPACGAFNTSNATTPVTLTWDYGTGLRVWDSTNTWWYNAGASSPVTVFGIPPGRTVYGQTTYNWSTFSDVGSTICPMPANQHTIVSGVLRQKSGIGCYQADASNNFHVTDISAATDDNCVTATCAASPGDSNAVAYSCDVLFNNQACVAQGRQPATTQTLTITTALDGYNSGQFSNTSCDLNGTHLSITAGVDSPNADLSFPVSNENWVKLKNTSFTAGSTTSNYIPVFVNKFTPSDSDDDALQKYFILGQSAGAALGINSNAYSSPNWDDSSYSKSLSMMSPATFISYVKSRKEYQTITNLSDLAEDKINIWQGDLTINDQNNFNNKKIVLLVTGTVTLDVPNFQPTNASLAIAAQTINFTSSVNYAEGLFIAQTINTGSNTTGLKIKGNLVAQSTFNNGRSWSDTSRPAVLIVFDQKPYLDLLPYLSTANYEWRQIQ